MTPERRLALLSASRLGRLVAFGTERSADAGFAGGREALDPDGRWITVSGNAVHVTKDGTPDAGGPPAVRAALTKSKSNPAPKATGKSKGPKASRTAPKVALPEGHKKVGEVAGGAVVGQAPNGDYTTHFPPGEPEKQAERLRPAIKDAMSELKLFPEFEDGPISTRALVHWVAREVPNTTTTDVIAALSHMGRKRECELHALNEVRTLLDEPKHGNGPLPGSTGLPTAALWQNGRAMGFVVPPRP